MRRGRRLQQFKFRRRLTLRHSCIQHILRKYGCIIFKALTYDYVLAHFKFLANKMCIWTLESKAQKRLILAKSKVCNTGQYFPPFYHSSCFLSRRRCHHPVLHHCLSPSSLDTHVWFAFHPLSTSHSYLFL